MRKIRLFIVALLVVCTAAAQPAHKEKRPVVYLFGVQQTALVDDDGSEQPCDNQAAIDRAVRDYLETHRPGFQQSMPPQLIFSSRSNRVSFAVGGFVNFRVAYDLHGIVDNLDFIPYDIPIPRTYDTRQQLQFDASTTRIFLKAMVNSRVLGRVVTYIETDFRGEGSRYIPRLRIAYISFKGFHFGRDVTTFCDLNSSPTTVDFQGPNSYNFNFATMVRYSRTFGTHFGMGVAAEMPHVSGTYNDNFSPMRQRVPDFPIFVEYKWGKMRDSHVRATAVLRDMYYHNDARDKNYAQLGWGVQLSGNVKIARMLNLMFNGVYGEGITPYIQDISGSGLDLVPDPANAGRLQTLPMWGWFAAAQINLAPGMFVSGGYSTVRVEKHHDYYTNNQYRKGDYVFGNLFVHITPRFQCALEYLYGVRKNMDTSKVHANRIQAMVQYNF